MAFLVGVFIEPEIVFLHPVFQVETGKGSLCGPFQNGMHNDFIITIGEDRKSRNVRKPQGGFGNTGQDGRVHGCRIDERNVIEAGRVGVFDQDANHFRIDVSAIGIALRTKEERPRRFIQYVDQILIRNLFFREVLKVTQGLTPGSKDQIGNQDQDYRGDQGNHSGQAKLFHPHYFSTVLLALLKKGRRAPVVLIR